MTTVACVLSLYLAAGLALFLFAVRTDRGLRVSLVLRPVSSLITLLIVACGWPVIMGVSFVHAVQQALRTADEQEQGGE